MLSENEKLEIGRMIGDFFELAGVSPAWNGTVNERVAEIFATMVFETRKCSTAFAWVPKPSGGKPTALWLITYFGENVFKTNSKKLSVTCARQVILNWKRELDLAELSLSHRKLAPSESSS